MSAAFKDNARPRLRFDLRGGQTLGDRSRKGSRYAIRQCGETQLAVLANGLEGRPYAGRVAECTVNSFVESAAPAFAREPRTEPGIILRHATERTHQEIATLGARWSLSGGLGTNLLAVSVSPQSERLHYVYAGDELLMRLNSGRIEELTLLHSEGAIVDSTIGIGIELLYCEDRGVAIAPGDQFVVASTGLYALKDSTIADILTKAPSAKSAVDALLHAVERRKHVFRGDTTVVVLQVGEEGA